jgi:hypothetical protein
VLIRQQKKKIIFSFYPVLAPHHFACWSRGRKNFVGFCDFCTLPVPYKLKDETEPNNFVLIKIVWRRLCTKFLKNPYMYELFQISVVDPDPGSGAFLPPGSGIRIRDPDPGWIFSGSRIWPLF